MEDKDIYTLALMKYRKEHPNVDFDKMFSIDWNLNKNYKLKTIIIAEAIKNNVYVEETESYKEHFLTKKR